MLIFLIILIIVIFSIYILYRYYRLHVYAWIANFPKPKFKVICESDFKLSMPDGVKLATDIYRPKSRHKFPVVIIRTPYNKADPIYKNFASLFASQGYVIILQDVRGKHRSEGAFYPYAYEALDGNTTVTWAGEAKWSTGKVCLFGLSYSASCAWLAARYKNPYLRTIIYMFATQDTYSMWIDKGIPFLKGPLFWLTRYCKKKANLDITAKSLEPILWQLPVNKLDIQATGKKIPFYQEYLLHPYRDSFWKDISTNHLIEDLDIPTYIVSGWYDPFIAGTIEDYKQMNQSKLSQLNHKSSLTIGPWAHFPLQVIKGMEFGKNGRFPSLLPTILEWGDIWLKDKKYAKSQHQPIRYFMMGKNEWKEAQKWPPNKSEVQLYLSMESHVAHFNEGVLTSKPPAQIQKSHYIYNPHNPVLFKGSDLLHTDAWIAPIDQAEILARNEVLVFHTPTLKEELCIAGDVKLILYVSSTGLDTDFYAKICDKYPCGKAYNLTYGFIRMRYRDSLEKPQLITPGAIYKVEIVLRPVAHAFLKNHQLQLQITSSDFPVHNRNLNTGLRCETSIEIKEVEQTVYSGTPYESHLILPVL